MHKYNIHVHWISYLSQKCSVASFLLHTIYSKDLYYVSRKSEWFILIKLLVITESLPSLFVRGSSRLRTPVSITNAGEGSRTVSCWAGQLYFKLYPSLKFLSSHNSLRNFFSPSRGEIKMFLLIKPKIFFIFLNNSNRKRLCFFASSHLCVSNQTPPKCFKDLSWLPPPRRLFLNQI